jgi:hypothetical protein
LHAIAEFLGSERFAGCRLLATGFSRGGLGVLQLVSAFPNLISSWAVVDPQPSRNDGEESAILNSPAVGERGWVGYGDYRNRNAAWQRFRSALTSKIPTGNCGTTELSHPGMAFGVYSGIVVSNAGKSLYEFLNLEFRMPNDFAAKA